MYVYDRANELAKDIREASEYLNYKELKDKVYADETKKAMIMEYKRLQFQAQAALMTGGKPDENLMERLKKVGEVLAFDQDVSDFFAAEYKMNTMLTDIYKIIADASGIDIGMFANQ